MQDNQEFSSIQKAKIAKLPSFLQQDDYDTCEAPKSREQLQKLLSDLKQKLLEKKSQLSRCQLEIQQYKKGQQTFTTKYSQLEQNCQKYKVENKTFNGKITTLQAQKKRLTKENQEFKENIEKKKLQLQNQHNKYCDLQKKMSDAEKIIRDLKQDIKVKDTSLSESISKIKSYQQKLTALTIKWKKIETQLSSIKQEKQRLSVSLTLANSKIQEYKVTINSFTLQRQRFTSQIATKQNTIQQYKCQIQSTKVIIIELNKEITKIQEQNKSFRETIINFQSTTRSFNKEKQRLIKECKEKDEKIKQLTNENCSLTIKFEAFITEISSLKCTISQTEKTIAQFKSEIYAKQLIIEEINSKLSFQKREYQQLIWKFEQITTRFTNSTQIIVLKQKVIVELNEKINTLRCTISTKQTENYSLKISLKSEKQQNSYLILKNTNLINENNLINTEIIKLNQTILNISTKIIECDRKICQLNETIKIHVGKISSLEIDITRYKEAISSKDLQIKRFESDIIKFNQIISSKKVQIDQCRQIIQSKDKQITSLTINIKKINEQINNIQIIYEKLQRECKSKEAQYTRIKDLNVQLQIQIKGKKQTIIKIQEEKSVLNKRLEQLSGRYQKLVCQSNQDKANLKSCRQMLEISKTNVSQLRSQITILTKQQQIISKDYNSSKLKIYQLTSTIQKIKVQLSSLQQDNCSLKSKFECSQKLIVELKQNLEINEKRIISAKEKYFQLAKNYQQKCFEYDSLQGEKKKIIYLNSELKMKITYLEYQIKQKISSINVFIKEIESLKCGANTQIKLIKSLMTLIKQGKYSMDRFDDTFSQLVAKISEFEICSSSYSSNRVCADSNEYSYSEYPYELSIEAAVRAEILEFSQNRATQQQTKKQQVIEKVAEPEDIQEKTIQEVIEMKAPENRQKDIIQSSANKPKMKRLKNRLEVHSNGQNQEREQGPPTGEQHEVISSQEEFEGSK